MSHQERPPDDSAATLASVPPGAKFDRYEIVRLIGAGGMGNVYEARHVDLDKRVALKVLSQKIAGNKVYLERFLREGRIAAKLDHPHVVSVFDVGTHAGKPYMVMEFLNGRDLDSLLGERKALGVEEAVDLTLPILAALDVAHVAGLVHRDIKPANIFLQRAAHGGWHPKLLDFGIAKPNQEEGAGLTGTAEVFGTPQYMAPEQVRRSKDATSRSDEYAMGAVLYRCLAGVEAFEFGESSVYDVLERVVSGTFPPLRDVRAEVPEQLAAVVHRAMRRSPMERFTSVRELGAALLPFASPSARQLWTVAFAKPDAVADTIAPPGRPSTATEVSSSQPSIATAESAPDAATVQQQTLTTVARDATPALRGSPPSRGASRRSLLLGAGGVVIGGGATLYLLSSLMGAQEVGPPSAASSRAALSSASGGEVAGQASATATSAPPVEQPAVTLAPSELAVDAGTSADVASAKPAGKRRPPASGALASTSTTAKATADASVKPSAAPKPSVTTTGSYEIQ